MFACVRACLHVSRADSAGGAKKIVKRLNLVEANSVEFLE
jgi:hypothetical protein